MSRYRYLVKRISQKILNDFSFNGNIRGTLVSKRGPSIKFAFPNHCLKHLKILETNRRLISTSSQWNSIYPIELMSSFLAIATISPTIFGIVMRKWWQTLSPHEQTKVREKLRSRQTHLTFGVAVFFGLVWIYYLKHMKEEPITKRNRVILFSDKEMDAIAQNKFQKDQLEPVPESDSLYIKVVILVNQILLANLNLPQVKRKQWDVIVIDRPDIANALVLPNGKIVVFTGIQNIVTNDDQLAIVLSHEIAHSLLSHPAELLSKCVLFKMFSMLPLAVAWAIMPVHKAIFLLCASLFLEKVTYLALSRAHESEADLVGLFLAARACFDVREASVFYENIAKVLQEPVEWQSTHPSSRTRQHQLAQLIHEALGIREMCMCPELPPISAA